MKNSIKYKLMMTGLLVGSLMTNGIAKANDNEGFDVAGIGNVIVNYQKFLNSPAKSNLEEYLRQDEDNTFDQVYQDGITLDQVNFRKGPGLNYDVIELLDPEQSLDVLGTCNNDWYLVSYNGQLGFVYGEYLRVIDPNFVESQLLEYRPTFLCAVEAVHGANIRETPDVKTGRIIGGLNIGDKIPAYEKLDNGWYHINFNGQNSYIFGELVKEIYATSVDNYPMFLVTEEAPFLEKPYNDKIDTVNESTYMYLLGENDDYFYTQYNGKFGYIMKNHCERLTDTYVVVDVSDQEMKIYNRGQEIFSSYVVTGKDTTPTTIGAHYVRSKERNVILRGPGYETPVEYWMPFHNGEGLHDAYWRDYFGGEIYHYGGTHGCVNMPKEITPYVYDTLHVGDRVFIKQ